MNVDQLRRAGHISLGFALVAATVGALSLMSVTSTAYGKEGADDGGSESRGGDDGPGDDNGQRHGGHGADDAAGDDHGRRHGGHGADDGVAGGGAGSVILPLGSVVSEWESQGYRVLDISREDGSVVELEVITPAGQHVEMYVDTATSKILSQQLED